MEYEIELYDGGKVPSMGIDGEFDDDAAAINWAWYYLGLYRSQTGKLYRGEHTNPRRKSDLVVEISSEGREKLFA
jgi:hypothetical protein